MPVLTELKQIKSAVPCAIALGFFDGVHIGHRAVIDAAVNNGLGLEPAVFTFYDHPRKNVPLITDCDSRFALIQSLGVKTVYAPRFAQLAQMSAEDFFNFLINDLSAKMLTFGHSYRFGAGGAGDSELLTRFCRERAIPYFCSPIVTVDGEQVNSTAIRALLERGDMEKAAQMLGRRYCFTARVLHGKNLGHLLGFATINQELAEGLLQPCNGVYAGFCELDGVCFRSVTNYGSRPTAGQRAIAAETHIIGYEGDLYGRTVTVCLTRYLRPQVKFDSMTELTAQIERDVREALK